MTRGRRRPDHIAPAAGMGVIAEVPGWLTEIRSRRPRSDRDPRVDRIDRLGAQDAGRGARALPARATHRLHAPLRRLPAVPSEHRLRQHDPRLAREALSRATANSSDASRPASAGTRWRWWSTPTVSSEYGGHLSTYASSATLYEVGFNHFWRAPSRASPRRHGVRAGSFVARHLCARLSRRPADRRPAEAFPPGSAAATDCRPIRIPG